MKKTVLTLILFVLPFAAAFCRPAAVDTLRVTPSELADLIVEEGMKLQGTPYRYGASGPKAYDCSAFTGYVFRQFGIQLGRSAKEQAAQGREVSGSMSNLQKGDIVVFGSRRSKKTIGHVGIFIALDESGKDFTFIHAAVHGGVRVSRLSEGYYATRFLGARRFIPDFIDVDSLGGPVETFDTANVVVPVKDTLNLGENDMRLVLLADGGWYCVDGQGNVSRPDSLLERRLVLSSDGTWTELSVSPMEIPVVREATASAAGEGTSASATASADSGDAAASADQPVYYTVKSGDSLSKIASRYKVSVNSICRLNGISSKSILKVGKKLRVK